MENKIKNIENTEKVEAVKNTEAVENIKIENIENVKEKPNAGKYKTTEAGLEIKECISALDKEQLLNLFKQFSKEELVSMYYKLWYLKPEKKQKEHAELLKSAIKIVKPVVDANALKGLF